MRFYTLLSLYRRLRSKAQALTAKICTSLLETMTQFLMSMIFMQARLDRRLRTTALVLWRERLHLSRSAIRAGPCLLLRLLSCSRSTSILWSFDHISGVDTVTAVYPVPLAIHPADVPMYTDKAMAAMYGRQALLVKRNRTFF
jgi:hypothetical protein